MEPIEDQVIGLQTRNFESASFVPASDLERLLTEDVVRTTIRESTIDVWKKDEAIRIVMSGAKRVFAILVFQGKLHLLSKFIENDQFHKGELDAKLPISEATLQALLGKAAGRSFWDNQWIFVAPVFRHDLSHRRLENPVVLPFIQSSPIGEGAFGVVSEVVLHAQHQGLQEVKKDGLAVKLVRKYIQLGNTSSGNHEQEGDVLSTLRLVQHANIVRLVTTFEYRNTYNLLFEPAEYSLKELLSKDTRPPLWRNDVSFFIALQGLASALATLHDFHVSELNVQHIGCHHDLKPANVLVNNGTFLLADFGLSRLKPLEGDSKTLFRGISHHNAPECLDFDAGYSSSQIGRKSDVWALGTIMLDIVTYLLRGPRGLDEFEKNRKHKIGAITFYYFHYGGHDHPTVLSHIQGLETEASSSWQPIFTLIRSTLQVDQHHRPAASHLVASLSFAVLKIQGLSVLSRLEDYTMSVEVNQINIELVTLRIWTTLVGLRDTAGNWSSIAKATRDEVDFLQFSICLSELDFTLCGLENIGTRPTVGSVRQLTRHVDHLVEGLNFANRSKLNNLLEIELLQGITVTNWPDLSHTQWPSATTSFSLLAAAKVVAQQDDAQALGLRSAKELDKDKIKDQRAFGSQSEMALFEDQVPTPVLIEWIQYDRKWLGDVGKELLQRVRALASILHTEPKPPGFSVLHCLGFYHAKERHSFGLVFSLPTHATQLKTLKQLLTEIPAQAFAARPSLGHVFMLSSALANSILQFHKVNWLHKEISSLNICFACNSTAATTADVTKPYLIGFNHSRPDNPDALTHGPNQNPEQMDYTHPEYLRDDARFRNSYDYYSLGLVLLELGLWRTLSSLAATMKNEDDQSPEALRKFLLKRYVPRLSATMGSVYKGVVVRCLTSDFGIGNDVEAENGHISILTAFEENVVSPLNTCKA